VRLGFASRPLASCPGAAHGPGAVVGAEPELSGAAQAILRASRGHWGRENRTHRGRELTFDETAAGSAAVRPSRSSLSSRPWIALARRTGWSNIAEAHRSYAGRPRRAVGPVASPDENEMALTS
jgi:hypothetical protein